VAQWARWKTADGQRGFRGSAFAPPRNHRRLTLLDTVLAGLAVVVDLACDALDALVVVVLGAVALARVAALWALELAGPWVARGPMGTLTLLERLLGVNNLVLVLVLGLGLVVVVVAGAVALLARLGL
jgi:hypothetical protein